MPFDPPRGGLYAGLIAGCAAGLMLVVAAPWTAHRGGWAAPLLYAVFDPLCHQLPERSFWWWDEPLAVCHRCAGLYLGFALGILAWPAFPGAAARLLARPRWIVACSAPLALDALLLVNTAVTRFGSGLIAAFPLALLALAAASQLAGRHGGRPLQQPVGAGLRPGPTWRSS